MPRQNRWEQVVLGYSFMNCRLTVFGLHRIVEVFGGREQLIRAFCEKVLQNYASAGGIMCFEQIDHALEWCRRRRREDPLVQPYVREVERWLCTKVPGRILHEHDAEDQGKRILFALACEARARAEHHDKRTVGEDFVYVALSDLARHQVCHPLEADVSAVDAIAQELRRQGLISYDERQDGWKANVLLHLFTPQEWFGEEVERLRS
jgi:hypothetical protein